MMRGSFLCIQSVVSEFIFSALAYEGLLPDQGYGQITDSCLIL